MGGFFELTVEDATRYVRYMAWMASTPKGSDRPRHEAYGDMREPAAGCTWLVNEASECGLFTNSGFGLSPVTWQEIHAWSSSVGHASQWLQKVVRDLSMEYVKESNRAQSPSCPCPLDVEVEQQRKTVVNQLKRFIKSRS